MPVAKKPILMGFRFFFLYIFQMKFNEFFFIFFKRIDGVDFLYFETCFKQFDHFVIRTHTHNCGSIVVVVFLGLVRFLIFKGFCIRVLRVLK